MEKLPFRVGKGCLIPASNWVFERLRQRKYKQDDIIFAVLTKPRNPKFNAFVHAGLAALLKKNIDDFKYMTPHQILKRIQIETGIGCDLIGVNFPGIGPAEYRVPKSLSFESMGQEEFHDTVRDFCRYISEKYWPDMSPEKIEEMAEVTVNE